MTKSQKSGSAGPDSASITRILGLAHRRADEITKTFGPAGTSVGYRKTLAL